MAIKSQSGREQEQERDRVNCERHRGDDTTEDFDLTRQLQALKQMNDDSAATATATATMMVTTNERHDC
jgi:hypothetical protein